MKRAAREFGFAFLAWLVPFAMSVCVFRLRATHRPLFEIVMSLTLTANTALLGLIYLRRVTQDHLLRAAGAGAAWTIANWALDLLMFSNGPMQMPFDRYLQEIAGAYLVIPVVTVALAAAARPRRPTGCGRSRSRFSNLLMNQGRVMSEGPGTGKGGRS